MGSPHTHKPEFYGTATIGTKGQIVIPANAREELNLNPGDKVVVIGIKEHNMLGICHISGVQKMLARMNEQLEHMRQFMEKTKE